MNALNLSAEGHTTNSTACHWVQLDSLSLFLLLTIERAPDSEHWVLLLATDVCTQHPIGCVNGGVYEASPFDLHSQSHHLHHQPWTCCSSPSRERLFTRTVDD